jgi:ADP-heptose:LPS heptosyltransferase
MDVKKIIISRTDSIGDVVLTLPVAGILKKLIPGCHIIFLGRSYTREIAEASSNIDHFVDWEEIKSHAFEFQLQQITKLHADAIIHIFPVREIAMLAYKARIPIRIGTTGRFYHYFTCNKLVAISRRHSELHEAQLNLKLIKPLGGLNFYSKEDIRIHYGFQISEPLDTSIKKLIEPDKFNLVLHPKSRGSAREWGIANFSKLIGILPPDKFRVFITGTAQEGEMINNEIFNKHPNVIDLTGKLSLTQLISFISEIDGIIAASTGPLHIAAALGKYALGIYPPIKPMHPGRWAPLGETADYIVLEKYCSKCRKENSCECMELITPETVYDKLIAKITNHG